MEPIKSDPVSLQVLLTLFGNLYENPYLWDTYPFCQEVFLGQAFVADALISHFIIVWVHGINIWVYILQVIISMCVISSHVVTEWYFYISKYLENIKLVHSNEIGN